MIKVTINIYEDGYTDYLLEGVGIGVNGECNDITQLSEKRQKYIKSKVIEALEEY